MYFPSKLSKIPSNANSNDLFLVHLNVRSLSKNKHKLEELFNDCTRFPDLIAISETKLNPNSTTRINIPNYHFHRQDSHTLAREVEIYIKESINYKIRQDLALKLHDCEDLWIEITTKQSCKSLIYAVIYRHPHRSSKSFQKKLCDILLSLESKKNFYIVCGDVNINLLNINLPRIKEYVDLLCCVGCSQLVDIPTRFSYDIKCKPSLLDHIYININKTYKLNVDLRKTCDPN